MFTKFVEFVDKLFDQTIIRTTVTTTYTKIVPNVPSADGRFHLVTNPNPVKEEDQ